MTLELNYEERKELKDKIMGVPNLMEHALDRIELNSRMYEKAHHAFKEIEEFINNELIKILDSALKNQGSIDLCPFTRTHAQILFSLRANLFSLEFPIKMSKLSLTTLWDYHLKELEELKDK